VPSPMRLRTHSVNRIQWVDQSPTQPLHPMRELTKKIPKASFTSVVFSPPTGLGIGGDLVNPPFHPVPSLPTISRHFSV
jgi:hypothetical protein